MIDLTPLDVRNKRGDFGKILRGYDTQEVDTFLELVAERLEELVLQNLQLTERVEGLQRQVDSQSGREQAVQEALVTAQELRSEMKGQAEREAELVLSEARTEARRLVAEAEAEARTLLRDTERRIESGKAALDELERRRGRFLKAFRGLLERELDVCQVEEERAPLEDRPIELDLRGGLVGSRADRAGEGSALPEVRAERAAEPPPTPHDVAASEAEAGPDVEAAGVLEAPVAEAPEGGEEEAPRTIADEVRAALAGLEAASGGGEEGLLDGADDDETLSLSFDETAAPDDEARG